MTKDDNQSLIRDYDLEMNLLLEAARKNHVNINRFRIMVKQYGGYNTAKRLIPDPEVSPGLKSLWEAKLLHMSAEAVAIKPKYAPIFSEEEIAISRYKLRELNYPEQ